MTDGIPGDGYTETDHHRDSLVYNITEDIAVNIEDQGLVYNYSELETVVRQSITRFLGGKTAEELAKYDFQNWSDDK